MLSGRGSAQHERASRPGRRRHPQFRWTTRWAGRGMPHRAARSPKMQQRRESATFLQASRAAHRLADRPRRAPWSPPAGRLTAVVAARSRCQASARHRTARVREPLRGRVTPVFAPRALSNGTRPPARLRQARTLSGACPLTILAAGAQAIVGVRPPPPPRDTIADGGDASSDETALASVRARHRAAHDRGRTACAVADSSGPRVLSDGIRAKHQG
jgi:hypothetical protein